jgi:hypothetical protein
VDTVEALRSALASEADVQLVVAHHLLETPEFRALMQDMEEGQQGGDVPAAHHLALAEEEGEDDELGTSSGIAQETPEESRDSFGMASSSDGNSRGGSGYLPADCSNSNSILSSMHYHDHTDDDDEDITLQDLIAVETIDESQMPADDDDDVDDDSDHNDDPDPADVVVDHHHDDDDMSWTNQLSMDSFQYISHVLGYSGPFRCEKCGLNYTSLNEYRLHGRSRCCSRRRGRGEEGKQQQQLGAAAEGEEEPQQLLIRFQVPVKCEVAAAAAAVAPVKIEEESSNSSSQAAVRQQAGGVAAAAATAAASGQAVKSEPTVAGQVSEREKCCSLPAV